MKAVEPKEVVEPVRVDEIRLQIQNAVYYFDDVQKVRIATGNRICSIYRQGLDAEDAEKAKEDFLKQLHSEYLRITDYYADKMKSKGRLTTALGKVEGLKWIKSKNDLDLIDNYETLCEAEEKASKAMTYAVHQHPMWNLFFKNAKGCGPSIAGKLIAGLDVHKARHVSSFWSYCGVGTRVNENGERVAMTKRNTTTCTYIDKNGNEKTRRSLGYSPELQSLVTSVFVTSVLKVGKGSVYWECYYDYKNRYSNRSDLKGASKLRIHRMACRQVAKALLRDLWVAWRSYEGYTLSQPYEVEYLGYAPHKYNEAHSRRAQSLY